ncbi:MAG: mechanosensitive ion channel family protein [Planctomycetota bacterium]
MSVRQGSSGLVPATMLLVGLLALVGGSGQDEPPAAAETAASQPESQPAAASQPTTATANPLVTPYRAIEFFLQTVRDPERGDEKFQDAMVCLDFGDMSAEEIATIGPQVVQQLDEILRRMQAEGWFDPEDLEVFPDEPAGTVQSFGVDTLALELLRMAQTETDPVNDERYTRNVWKFPSYIVTQIPTWHQELDERVRRGKLGEEPTSPQPAASDTAQVAPEDLQTIHGTVRFFLDRWSAAQKDGSHYVVALACLDFSDVVRDALKQETELDDPAEVEEALQQRGAEFVQQVTDREGIQRVDGLHRILQAMLDEGSLVLEDLPSKPGQHNKSTYSISSMMYKGVAVTLVRQGDAPAQWRFSARTTMDVPRMVDAVKAGPTEPLVVPGSGDGTQDAGAGRASEAAAPSAARDGETAPPRDETGSPRATLQTFLDAMQEREIDLAVSCLDLSELDAKEREFASVLAGKLWLVLARSQKVLPATLSDDPGAPGQEPLLSPRPEGRIQINRERSGPRSGEWLFSSQTVRDIEQLYKAVESLPIHQSWWTKEGPGLVSFMALPSLYVRELINAQINDRIVEVTDPVTGQPEQQTSRGRLPRWLGNEFQGLQTWQWLGFVLVLLFGLAVRWLCQLLLPRVSRWLLRTEAVEILPQVARKAMSPTSNLAMVASWWGLLQFLDLGATVMTWIWLVLRIAMTLVGVLAFYRLTDVVMGYFTARAAATSSRLDDVLVPLLKKTLKVIVVAVGLILFVKVLGYQVTPLLAGLGVGGLAFGLAAQDTLKNFFGSVNVVLDRPFQVGDWVKMGDVEGTVESVGLRSSRIRTFYNSQITVPNSEIMTSKVDNLGRRRYRRISCMLSLTYDTPPEKLEAFCEGVRELIRLHPYTRKDYYHCWVNKFAAASLDVMLYCFHECPEWGTELRERHRLFLDIIRLAKRLGVEFAFPTQTIHMHHESLPPDSPPVPPDVPGDPTVAMKFGAEQAAQLAREHGEAEEEKPPPVEY